MLWSREFLEEIASKYQLTLNEKAVFLEKILNSDCDEVQIARKLNITHDAVRNRFSGVYRKFSIKGKGPGKYSHLLEFLIAESKKHKTSSVNRNHNAPQELSSVRNAELSNDYSNAHIEVPRPLAQNDPALPLASASTESNMKPFALAQQMRGWFETLGYVFETSYEIRKDNYVEWIINIQGEQGYDRILVRGIEGEARVKDVIALQNAVKLHHTDKGWLISARRIAPAARDEVKKQERGDIFCYTFDELLDQRADFRGYIDWLEAEVKRHFIDTKYVPLACTKEEIDPITKQQIAVSRYDEDYGWIDGYIDLWLDDPAKEHISILGEFGTGKTWFALHYAWVALQRYRQAQKRGVERPRLPLVIPLRDYAKVVSVESLFYQFFFRKHKIPHLNYPAFEQLNRMGKLLLIFDGFDEMAARVDRQKMINNFWELAKVVVPGSKVILTCRTEHFPEAKEGRALLNAELQASSAKLTGEAPQFEVLELEKFNDEQIRQILLHQGELSTVEILTNNQQLLDLARRPIMPELILEALPDIKADIEAGKSVDMSQIYLYAVRRKIEPDIKAKRTFTSLAEKLYFLCEFSWEMLSTEQMSLNYRHFSDRIRRLFDSVVQKENNLEQLQYDMMGQTVLTRNADGDYTLAHRSFLEFFVAYKFAAELGALASDFTELAQAHSRLDKSAAPVDYTWSSYFSHQLDETEFSACIPPLREFKSESLDKLRQTFGKAPLTKAVSDLLLPMFSNKESLIHVIEATRGKSEDEVGYVGGNAATLLVKLDEAALEGKDLSGTVIKGADFTNASLRGVNFSQANLSDSVFTKILGHIYSVAFSPDGKLLATGDSYGAIRLWEAANGKEIWTKTHINRVSSLAFSLDGTMLASCGADNTIQLYDIKSRGSGECLHILQGHNSWVYSVAFSPDGATLASGSADNTVRLWDINSGECLYTLQKHTNHVHSVAFSPDGATLASGSADNTVRLWDINSGECLDILQEHIGQVNSVIFSSDGVTLASGSADNTVRLWNISSGKCLYTLQKHTNQVYSVAFSPDGATLASGSADNTVRLWDINTGECLYILQEHISQINSVTFSPDGATLASGSDDYTVRLWKSNSGECRNILQGDKSWVYSVAFSPDGHTLASSGGDRVVRLWDINSAKCFHTLQGHTCDVNSIAFSPDGYTLASGSTDNTIRLWDINTGEYRNLLGHTSWVWPIAFSPDGTMLASGGGDQVVRLWNIDSGKYRNFLGHTSWVSSVAFSPDGVTLASGSADNTIRLWDINTGEYRNILEGYTSWINSVAFSPDGVTLASGSADNTIRLWDINTGEYRNMAGHTSWVWSVVFSPDGVTLASGSNDHTVRLWDINSNICLLTLQGHTSRVNSVAFSPDGATLASASTDGTIKLWCVKTGECFTTLINERPCDRMNITGVKGLTDAEIASLKALGAVEDGE